MIRSSQYVHGEPVYRDVLRNAFSAAWEGRRYWILSIFAGILVTAGSYDILSKAVTAITTSPTVQHLPGTSIVNALFARGIHGFDGVMALLGGIQLVLFFVFLVVALGGLSCVAQGGLVFALGAHRRGEKPSLSDAIRVGASALLPIVVLNASAFVVLWILRFLAAFPFFLTLPKESTASLAAYIASFIIFVPLSFAVSVVQILALNATILQGAPLKEALLRGYMMCKQHWLVMIETAVMQIVITFGIALVFIFAALFASVPFFLLIMTATIIKSAALFNICLISSLVLFIGALFAAAAFSIQMQYATWTYLYRRLGEGGVLPKLHRIVRELTGHFSVPQP